MQATYKTPHQLIAGDIVIAHGGEFEVTQSACPSVSYLPEDGIGPTDCAVAQAVCLSGEVQGYFRPGSTWAFQGNHSVNYKVKAK